LRQNTPSDDERASEAISPPGDNDNVRFAQYKAEQTTQERLVVAKIQLNQNLENGKGSYWYCKCQINYFGFGIPTKDRITQKMLTVKSFSALLWGYCAYSYA
jgi:hypothetical protein